MNSDYEQIKMILLGLSFVSDSQYNRLVQVYGEENVIDTIKELYNEDSSILLKVGKFVSKLYLNLDLNNGMKDSVDYYYDDLNMIRELESEEKKMLLYEIFQIIKKLNKLFDKVGNITDLENERVVPWISDKVDYCIVNCSDKDLLDKIKNMYSEYVEKRNILLETYLKFVISIAKYIRKENKIPMEDLIQNGNIGLIRAVEMYDLDKDTGFLTYAGYWIKQSIIYNSKKMLCHFKIPIRMYDLNIKRAMAIDYLISELGRMPKREEIADYLEISMSKLDDLVLLFSETISSEDLMIDDDIDSYYQVKDDMFEIDRDIMYEDMSSELNRIMDECLDEREKFILKSRYGFIPEMTLSELGRKYGVSWQRISQIEHNAFRKLYKNKEFKKMKVYLR